MKLSYSAISSYQTCPRQYRYRYVDCLPALPSPALSFGSTLHEALRWFYDVPTPVPRQPAELLEYLDSCWIREGYGSVEEETRYYYQARSVLEMFHRNNARDFRIPVALENYFRIDIGFCELSGQIDRVDRHPEGGFEIIDYKTNRRLPPARKLYDDLQLPIYNLAVERTWEVSPEKVTFYYLLHNHRHTIQVAPEFTERALAEIEKVALAIESEAFEPCRNNLCPWCDYIDVCPLWEGKPKPAKKTSVPPMDVGQAVDELFEATRRMELIEASTAGLTEIVASYLQKANTPSVGGSKAVASVDESGEIVIRPC